jgi:predicted PurR-regulated permease PerM
MALPVITQIKYWGFATAVFLILLWLMGEILLPFVLGAAIAYCLDPLADRLENTGLSRAKATAAITVVVILLFVAMTLLIAPTLVNQAVNLFEIMPSLTQSLSVWVTERFPNLLDEGSTLQSSINSLGNILQERGGELLNTVVNSAASIIDIIMLFIIAPVVAVYMLLDWNRLIATLDGLMPRDHAPAIRDIMRDIDDTLSGFIRGMGSVCLILGTYYAISLMLIGLQFGLIVGFVAGIMTFIPYLGPIIGGVLAVGLGLFQFWGDWVSIALVAGVFVIGQVVEGNFLTPKLVGGSVGLHPVWLIFSLSVFGSLFGFVGLLVAIPVAATIGVIVRFALEQYRESQLYQGTK